MEKLKELTEAIKENSSNAKIIPKIVGKWIFEDGQPQFTSSIEVEGGSFTVEADMPSKLGGWGTQPSPLHYCLYGLASCYAFTFAALAAMEGVTLKKLEIEAESHIDVSKVFGLSENPIVEEVKWKVIVESEADDEKIEKLKKLAEERCPAVYCLTKPVKLTVDLVRG
jgi:uncharacterized OsmC-like protein